MSLFNNAKLILTPNGYKDGKLYTLKPFDGSKDFDVVRATKATRVDSNGLIVEENNHIIRLDYTENSCPCILVEEQRTNLFLHSEDFDNAYWTKTELNTSGSPTWVNVGNAPDGTMTADKLIANVNQSIHVVSRFNIPSSNVQRVLSVFLKAGELRDVRIIISGASATNRAEIRVNSLTGDVFFLNSFGTFTIAESKIESFPNNWFRISLKTFVPASESNINVQFFLFKDGGLIFSGNDIDGLFVWGAQLSNDFTSYIPTTTSTVTRNADIATVTPPVGVTQIIETFEDNSTNIITSIPSTYQLPVGRIKHIVML